ncbi:PREDICTED: T-cell-interacting, activating receptor on myeloid cells protein 1-like, partial [Myotis davidii]|uniref:T-cell-interacting, activating receptor on myeloid cells protein 1-like n=1 Tax=Myotis davidii TaxID=225400 RepID=UPI00076772D0
MIHTLLPLLCLRLCAGQDLRRDGELPKPSLHARPGRKVTAGENVILQCQLPRPVIEPHTFALLKKGTATPIQLQSAVGIQTEFPLPSVTISDTGAYSCVYYQPRAPFSASRPSDELTILVTGKDSARFCELQFPVQPD